MTDAAVPKTRRPNKGMKQTSVEHIGRSQLIPGVRLLEAGMGEKRRQLLDLARLRQRYCWTGYHALAEYHGGAYECDLVSPYTKTAGNVDSPIVILLQDWSSNERLRGPLDSGAAALGHTPGLPTNRNLKTLLRETFGLELEDVYGTNLFPFIKPGGISTRIPADDLERAAREFALPQIRIVKPVLVVCLGLVTFTAVQRACGVTPSVRLAEAIDSSFTFETSRIWCQAHTGSFGQNNRGRARVLADWQRMKPEVRRSLTRG
jgi:restriction system protein